MKAPNSYSEPRLCCSCVQLPNCACDDTVIGTDIMPYSVLVSAKLLQVRAGRLPAPKPQSHHSTGRATTDLAGLADHQSGLQAQVLRRCVYQASTTPLATDPVLCSSVCTAAGAAASLPCCCWCCSSCGGCCCCFRCLIICTNFATKKPAAAPITVLGACISRFFLSRRTVDLRCVLSARVVLSSCLRPSTFFLYAFW